VAPVTAMLIAQATTAPRFKEQCSTCHGSAADFARKSLVVEQGGLKGRTSRMPVADYLRHHGGLAPGDVAAMVATLQRVAGEVGEGGKR